jgi:hypothetical protein
MESMITVVDELCATHNRFFFILKERSSSITSNSDLYLLGNDSISELKSIRPTSTILAKKDEKSESFSRWRMHSRPAPVNH